MFDISFVTLTWNSERYVGNCLTSIIAQCSAEGLGFEIIVVDNGSADGSVDIIREYCARFPDRIRLLALGRNRGTTYTRNLALKQARSPVICIIDSDTEFLSGALRPVMTLLAAHPTLGIVAPRLLLPDGSVQHSVKRFPTFLDKLRKVPGILTGHAATRDDFYRSFPFDCCTHVETAISACWIFRASLLETVGLLDEGIFYSPEDLDYSARVREAGMRIVYYPHLMLRHHTQQITHRRPFSRLSLSHLKGLVRYHRRHRGWFVRTAGEPTRWPAGDEAFELPPRGQEVPRGAATGPRLGEPSCGVLRP